MEAKNVQRCNVTLFVTNVTVVLKLFWLLFEIILELIGLDLTLLLYIKTNKFIFYHYIFFKIVVYIVLFSTWENMSKEVVIIGQKADI